MLRTTVTGTMSGPPVSVILTTRDRPRFLAVALRCYKHQTYPHRELIVVDDGEEFPVAEQTVAALGGRLLHVEPGTPLGTKLNRGVEMARGPLCQKMDDDDWYAPRFLETMIGSVVSNRQRVCRPTLAFLMPFLFFDVARWEVRRSVDINAPGATLLFAREDWETGPFRPVRFDEDVWYVLDQLECGVTVLPVRALELFMAVRHRGASRDRGHTWTHQGNGEALEDYLGRRPLIAEGPEGLLPAWALQFYREVQRDSQRGGARSEPTRRRA
jgi:glycosyltransferase involved in cell wall biosynthesis